MSAHVRAVTMRADSQRHATVEIGEIARTAISTSRANFADLPADMQAALLAWVGAADIWREGWIAMGQEHMKQRNDPDYPIGQDFTNPYEEDAR